MDNHKLTIFLLITVIFSGFMVYFLNHFVFKKEEIIMLSSTDTINSIKSENITEEVYVHISGSVKRPGVYKLKKGMRIVEAIKIAGGSSSGADLDTLNLAEKIRDGQKIHITQKIHDIPAESQKNKIRKSSKKKKKNKTLKVKININSATEKDFQNLPGVGPSLAKKILSYRTNKGLFKTINDLVKVPGIGKKKLNKLKGYLCL